MRTNSCASTRLVPISSSIHVQVRQTDNGLFPQAEEDELLTYEIHIDEKDNTRLQNYFDEIKQLYIKDEFSKHVQEWNDQRCMAIERALNMILFPQMVKEIKAKLLEEAKECIIKVRAPFLAEVLRCLHKVIPVQLFTILG